MISLLIIVNIFISLLYMSNGLSQTIVLLSVVCSVWNMIILITHTKHIINPLTAIIASNITTIIWFNQPFGVIIGFTPIYILIFMGLKDKNNKDAVYIITTQSKIIAITYCLIMYTAKSVLYGFSMQDLLLFIAYGFIVYIIGSHFKAMALNMQKDLCMERAIAIQDKLTGLLSRTTMEDCINKIAKKINDFAIIMLDVDSFKSINDNYGHDKGDVVLKDLADIIKDNIRSTDVAFRYGGDEFIVVCPDTNTENAFLIAERIKTAFGQKEYIFNKKNVHVTSSLGVTECRYGEFISATDLIKKADKALYKAKNNGKNKIFSN